MKNKQKCNIGLALRYLLRADRLKSTDFISLYYIGWIYLDNLNKPDKAIDYFIRSVDKNWGYDASYSKLGEAYMK